MTCSNDLMDATVLTRSTTITMVFSMQKIGTTTTMVFSKGPSILMLSKHLDSTLETYPLTATLTPVSSIRGRAMQSVHSIFQTRIQWTMTTMVSPMRTLTVLDPVDTTKMTTTTRVLINSSGLAISIMMASRTTLTTTMMAMALMTLKTLTRTTQPSPQATQKLEISTTLRRHGTSIPTVSILAV